MGADPSPVTTCLHMKLDDKTGEPCGVVERDFDAVGGLSLLRPSGPRSDYVRGNAQRLPFKPGGLGDEHRSITAQADRDDDPLAFLSDTTACRMKPPGFSDDVLFGAIGQDEVDELVADEAFADQPTTLLARHGEMPHISAPKARRVETEEEEEEKGEDAVTLQRSDSLDDLLLDTDAQMIAKARRRAAEAEKERAMWVDTKATPISDRDFEAAVPHMAMTFPFKLDQFQKQAIVHLENNECVFVAAHTSAGKCLAPHTPVMMADGSVVRACDVCVGDSLMGDDSSPRTVLSTTSGRDIMYRVNPSYGDYYDVNGPHILSLKCVVEPCVNGCEVEYWDRGEERMIARTFSDEWHAKQFLSDLLTHHWDEGHVDISVDDYVRLDPRSRCALNGYHVPTTFQHSNVPIDPWAVGVMVGDGMVNGDSVVIEKLRSRVDCDVNIACWSIPDVYKYNDRTVQLQVLAGFLDVNGCLHKGGGFDIVLTHECPDIVFIARSLGFAAYITESNNGVWHARIHGQGLEGIPTVHPFKTAHASYDALTTPISIERLGDGVYCGFEIDGNRRFLLGDHTVTHNTVVAEYAIALSKHHMTRCVYTSPIKALSNQKFRDFKDKFDDVGLITGDVSINPQASCLIVTTEILRSMLYKGADLIRDIEWVVFDEVHYINDEERGVVWEEVIIMLPPHVSVVMLSATVPNAAEFSAWIGRTRNRVVHVVGTTKRPVPLEHHIWANGELYKVVDADGKFMELGHRNASHQPRQAGRGKGRGGKYGPMVMRSSGNNSSSGDRTQWLELLQYLKRRELYPVVIFAFSRRKCEEHAYSLTSLDLTTQKEKSAIKRQTEQALGRLTGTDRQLPQVLRIQQLLVRGIGLHHGGLLPIVKELVEIVFARGLVKILFATETFAMGVNMPARTVVFSGHRKHDGKQFRSLLPGEYTQMSGRAGRRGIDDTGTVILTQFGDGVLDSNSCYKLMAGMPAKLESQFRLTNNMMLNLLRVEEFRVEDVMRRSFSEFSEQKDSAQHTDMLKLGQQKLKATPTVQCIFNHTCPPIEDYYMLSDHYMSLCHDIRAKQATSHVLRRLLSVGHVIVLQSARHCNNLAAVIQANNSTSALVLRRETEQQCGTIDAVCRDGVARGSGGWAYDVVSVRHEDVLHVCRNTVAVDSTIMDKDSPSRKNVAKQLIAMAAVPLTLMDPIRDMRLNDIDFVDAVKTRRSVIDGIRASPCDACHMLTDHFAIEERRAMLKHSIDDLKYRLSEENLALMPEFRTRLAVLQSLGYIGEDLTVQLKGRIACEVNTVDSVIVAELVFAGALTGLCEEEIAALLSCLVFEQRSDSEPTINATLQRSYGVLVEKTTAIAERYHFHTYLHTYLRTSMSLYGLDVGVNEYLKEALHPGLMEVVYEWAHGTPFCDICDMTGISTPISTPISTQMFLRVAL